MTSPATTAPKTAPRRAPVLPALAALVRAELLKLVRVPAFIVPTVLFPSLIFAMFALPNLQSRLGGVNAGQYFVVSYAAYALLSTALFSFGVSVAAERGLGWTRLLRVTSLPASTYFLAKALAAVALGLLSVTLLVLFAGLVGRVAYDLPTLLLALAKLLVGMQVFVGLGLAIGYLGGPNSAAAIANVIFLPLSFASGLFIPVEVGPKFLQVIAPFTPGYHFAALGWGTLGVRDVGPEWTHWLWLLGYAAVFFGVALWAYRRDEGKRYG